MARNFRELEAKMTPAARERVKEGVRKAIEEMPLEQLRAAREMTQTQIAAILHVNQSAVSKLERRADMYVSTLAQFVKAMGGELEIRAVFPDGHVRITNFSDTKTEAA